MNPQRVSPQHLRDRHMKPVADTVIRLLLADDHPVMRGALANLLGYEPGFTVVGEADDGPSALRVWREQRPDICLLDVTMTGMDGFETLRRLRIATPAAKVIMLTSSDSYEDLARAHDAGAKAYITKSVRYPDLVAAIRAVHAGESPINDDLVRRAAVTPAEGPLTPREMEVLGLLRQGFTNLEIANLLGFSERTARFHVGSIKEKLSCTHRAEAVAKGYELGLFKTSSPPRKS